MERMERIERMEMERIERSKGAEEPALGGFAFIGKLRGLPPGRRNENGCLSLPGMFRVPFLQ